MTDSLRFSRTVRQWMDTFMHRSMGGWVRFVKASGFSMPQFMILMHIRYKEPYSISDLSEKMDISAAAASQLVDKLVQAELLVRTEDPNDRRAKQLVLAEKGRELIEQGIQERYRWVDELEEILSTQEKEKVAEAMEILMKKVETRE